MANKEKGFNIKIYAVVSFLAVASALLVICVTTFSSRYIAFHPEKVAESFVNTIVQSADGYNAYKNTLVSKNMKYGDFIRENYIAPAVNRDGENYSEDSFKGEKTKNDDGTLNGKLIADMYPVYEELIGNYGWDDYDSIFTLYIEELIVTREKIFGDKFFNDEVFFTCFEANVSSYGKKLTGTDEVIDEASGVKLSDKMTGVYETVYGEDYRLTVTAENITDKDADAYKRTLNNKLLETYGVSPDDISAVKTVLCKVTAGDKTVTEGEITVVKIGMSWYVDNTSTDTSEFYGFYE